MENNTKPTADGKPIPPVNPAESELADLLGKETSLMLCLTIDGFLKFQLKRKPLGQDGIPIFLKAAQKLVQVVKFDEINAASIRYADHELKNHELFSTWEEEPRNMVLTDLVAAYQQLATIMLKPQP